MSLVIAEKNLRLVGGLVAYAILAVIFFGIWRGMQRTTGRTTGRATGWLRSPWFYLVTSAIFFGLCYLSWKPLPQQFSPGSRTFMLLAGSLLYFPGMAFILWGRLVLGRNYFVSTSLGAQLFEGHKLVTTGPFAVVRHPMYFGLFISALGSILIYPTWTTLLFAAFAPSIILRARSEERTLQAEFGDQWQEYCRRVPIFFPRLFHGRSR